MNIQADLPSRCVLALAVACLLSSSALAGGVVIHVDDDAAFGGDGSSWNSAIVRLQDAFAIAGESDEIRIAQGTYRPDVGGGQIPGDRDSTFWLKSGLVLKGGYRGLASGGAPDDRDASAFPTILTGDLAGDDVTDFSEHDENSVSVMRGLDLPLPVMLDGLVIEGGNSSNATGGLGLVGGLSMRDCELVMRDCVVRWNLGGGVNLIECTVLIEDSDFEDNLVGGGLAVRGNSLVVRGCTIQRNRPGGGMYLVVNHPEAVGLVEHCVIQDNVNTTWGGGLVGFSGQGTLIVRDVQFIGNQASRGGGAILRGTGANFNKLELTSCTFRDNNCLDGESIGSGGGAYIDATDAVISDCVFEGNRAVTAGGLDYSDDEVIKMTGCSFFGNHAEWGYGGGAVLREVKASVVNCVFSGNTARTFGGGLAQFQNGGAAGPKIRDCTFHGNKSGLEAAGLYVSDGDGTVGNCILWGNQSLTYQGQEAQFSGSTAELNYSCVQDLSVPSSGMGNIDADPMFTDASGPDGVVGTADDDLSLSAGSPCIDAGSNSWIGRDVADQDQDGSVVEDVPVDILGSARRVDDPLVVNTGQGTDPIVDMGAFEARLCYVDRYCDALPNSLGASVVLDWQGSLSLAMNNATISAGVLPPGVSALVFYGPEQADVPLGNGRLCVGGGGQGLFRISPVVNADILGLLTIPIDFSAPPMDAGPGQVLPGDAWNF